MSLGMQGKIRTGIVQPVGHQSSIVLNTRAQYGLVSKRMNSDVLVEKSTDDNEDPEAKRRKKKHMIPQPRNDWVSLLTVFMPELAFRDPPDFTFSARESSIHNADTEVFTSFNHRVYDEDNLPVFLGVVDRGQKPHPREADTESSGVVIAMQGTRSSYNTSHQTIHVGDSVYWDIPELIEDQNGRLIPDRPEIDGVPVDKLLAITISLPQAWSSAFRLGKHIARRYNDFNDLLQHIGSQGIPRFLQGPILTALAVKNGWAGNLDADLRLKAPVWFPEFTKTQDFAVGAGELADLINRRLLSHWIGTAYNTALPGQQFDLMLRG